MDSWTPLEKRFANTYLSRASLIGVQVHQAVIDAGEEESGCTIHEVTETVDGGPIVVQKKVKVC
jgi:folate-dependent phosphoribosylglycinamide formyltransferase PurN